MEDLALLDYDFSTSMRKINKIIRKVEDSVLAEYGLSHFHSKYILNLFKFGQLNMTELSDFIGVDKANTTRAVKDLISKGYVEKVGEGERKFNLQLSPAGIKIAKSFKQHANSMLDKAFSDFTEEEKITFKELLLKLFKGVKDAGNC